jgi:hypothetical protein
MAVKGDRNGLPRGNKGVKRVTSLITPEELKRTYLYGISFKDSDGVEMPLSAFQTYIDNAVAMLETFLDIKITRENIVENRDYRLNEYAQWGYFELSNYPALCINKIELVYFRDDQGQPDVIQEIPGNWIRLQEHDGLVRLIPNARFPASLQVSNTGNYFPEILRTDMVPHLWRIDYDYGFEDGCIPVLINQAIALIASIQALIVGGNLVLGAGIAGSSISLDGLSQSIQTTQSAENSALSATMKDYANRLYGENKDDPFAILKQLKAYYKGQDFEFI